jgi:hypothetical protein
MILRGDYELSSFERKTKKYIEFTPDEIKRYLNDVRRMILEGKYTISLNANRQENIDFIEAYKIDSKKKKRSYLVFNMMIFAML